MNDNNNNLLELGGSVDLIATAICDFDTPTRQYKKGDVVLSYKSVYMMPHFNTKTVSINNRKNQISYNNYILDYLRFDYIPLEKDIYYLFSTDIKPRKVNILQEEKVICYNNTLFLTKVAVDNKVQIKDFDGKTYEVFTKNDITYIVSESFEEGKQYIVWYNIDYEGYNFTLDSCDANIPYLQLQIACHGNNDKKDSTNYILIDKASLHYRPNLVFKDDSVSYCDLIFVIVDSDILPTMVI